MFNKPIDKMNHKELCGAVQTLYDAYERLKRSYEDGIANLDSSNFSKAFTVEQNGMKAQITLNAEKIETKISNTDLTSALSSYSTIKQTADAISSTVTKEYMTTALGDEYELAENAAAQYSALSSEISQTASTIKAEVSATYETKDDADDAYAKLKSSITLSNNEISAIVSGDYTEDILSGYLSGLTISPTGIKLQHNSAYSVYNEDGLRFFDSANQLEGWSIEPAENYGGILNYYINDTNCYTFGTGITGEGYADTFMVIKAVSSSRGGFAVDVAQSGYPEVKFVGLNEATGSNTPYIYANGHLLATQDWVTNNAPSGNVVAVFG